MSNFPSFSEGLSLRLNQQTRKPPTERENFPSFSEGLSLRRLHHRWQHCAGAAFPFLFGRAFIEALLHPVESGVVEHFPSFSEGLSLRPGNGEGWFDIYEFPFLFGRAFIEAPRRVGPRRWFSTFPFLFGRAFIEACSLIRSGRPCILYFPSFSEGLSLRLG